MIDAAPALHGVRVVEVNDRLGRYAGRLLAMLGADVITVELSAGDDGQVSEAHQPADAFDRYLDAGKRVIRLDLDSEHERATMRALIDSADLVLTEPSCPARKMARESGAIDISTSAFGAGLGTPNREVDDLLVMAAGGLLHLGGYTDSGPVVAYGSQSTIAAGIFTAVAAITALVARERHGFVTSADVSAQECVAQALEDSVATYALTGEIRHAQGEEAREAGTGVYRCADGYISMVAGRLGTARAWAALTHWLQAEEPTAAILSEPQWSDFSYRQSDGACDRFREVFERFASSRSKHDLYVEAQARQIALSPVNTIADLLENEQLESRGFFYRYTDDALGREVVSPGPPFRMSRTPLIEVESPGRVDPSDLLREADVARGGQ